MGYKSLCRQAIKRITLGAVDLTKPAKKPIVMASPTTFRLDAEASGRSHAETKCHLTRMNAIRVKPVPRKPVPSLARAKRESACQELGINREATASPNPSIIRESYTLPASECITVEGEGTSDEVTRPRYQLRDIPYTWKHCSPGLRVLHTSPILKVTNWTDRDEAQWQATFSNTLDDVMRHHDHEWQRAN